MKGEAVTLVYRGRAIGKDAFGGDVCEDTVQEVKNVLVQPADTSDDPGSNRPDGIRTKWRLIFPKLFVYGIDLEIFRGASVIVRGKEYKVIGSPGSFDADNCPTDWCMGVYVEDIDG